MRIIESYLVFKFIIKNGSSLVIDTLICYKDSRVIKKIKTDSIIIIPSRVIMKMFIYNIDLSRERNFIFESKLKKVHVAIIDHGHFVVVINTKLTL